MDYMGYALTQILVTGASGYLGSHVLLKLREMGVKALGVGRTEQSDIFCDLRDKLATKVLVEQYPDSTIIHCAAAVPKSNADYSDEVAASESLEMVRNLVNVSPRALVFVSSMTVYPEGIIVAREEDAAQIGRGYAASKFQAEQISLKNESITTTILRIPGLFGSPRRSGVLFDSALTLARGGLPVLCSPLPQWAAMHVEDAAEICVRAALASPSCSAVMNVGYSGRLSIVEAVTQLASLYGKKISTPEPKWFAFDLSRLHAHLGPVSGNFIERLNDLENWVRMEVRKDNGA